MASSPAAVAPGTADRAAARPHQGAEAGVLGALPVRQCEAIILHTHSSLSRRQAAEVMGISVGALSSHLARGLPSLARPHQPE